MGGFLRFIAWLLVIRLLTELFRVPSGFLNVSVIQGMLKTGLHFGNVLSAAPCAFFDFFIGQVALPKAGKDD